MFGGGQCARCFQPIPASALVMRSGGLTFHPQCFSCQVGLKRHVPPAPLRPLTCAAPVLQECDVTLMPGNLYCMQGQNLYCQAHYQGDGGVPQPKPTLTEGEWAELLLHGGVFRSNHD